MLRGSLKKIRLRPIEVLNSRDLLPIASRSVSRKFPVQQPKSVCLGGRLFHSVGSNQNHHAFKEYLPWNQVVDHERVADVTESMMSFMPVLAAPVLRLLVKEIFKKRPEPSHVIPPEPDFPVLERKLLHTDLNEAFKTLDEKKGYCRTVYLTGLPGTGKSELARQFAESMKSSVNFVGVIDLHKLSEDYRYRKFVKDLDQSETDRQKTSSDSEHSQKLSLDDIARKLKILLKKKKWLIVLENYNSQPSTERSLTTLQGDLKKLLPHPGSKDWGAGMLLVTTTDTIVANSTKNSTAMRLGLLSIDDGQDLLCKIIGGNYQMSEGDRRAFKEISDKQNWRLFPVEIVCAAREIENKRQSNRLRTHHYNFKLYCEDHNLKSTPLNHPNEIAIENLAVTQANESSSLKTVFSVLAMCPEQAEIPSVLFERLLDELGARNIANEMDKVKSCVLFDVTEESSSHASSVSVHRLTQKIFQKLFWTENTTSTCISSSDQAQPTCSEQRVTLMAKLIKYITEEYEDLFFVSDSSQMVSNLQHSLVQLLEAFHTEEYINNKSFPQELKTNALCVLSNGKIRTSPDEAMSILSPCLTRMEASSTRGDERANLYYHAGKIFRHMNDSRAMQMLDDAIRLSSDHQRVILMRKERAILKRKLGDYHGAMKDLDAMAHLCCKHLKDNSLTIARIQAHIGRDLYEAGETEKGLKMTKRGLEICRQERIPRSDTTSSWVDPWSWISRIRTRNVTTTHDSVYLSALMLRGMVLCGEGKWIEAQARFKEAQELQQKVFPKNDRYATQMKTLLGIASYKHGKTKNVSELLKQAETMLSKGYFEHQFSAFYCLEYAKILSNLEKQWNEAIKYASLVIDSIQNAYGSSVHPKVAEAHQLLVKLYMYTWSDGDIGTLNKARYHSKQAIDVFDKLIKSAETNFSSEEDQIQSFLLSEKWKKMKKATIKLN